MEFSILRFDSIDSTNSEALRRARSDAGEGLCVVARQQSAGRGRLGRTWNSPANAGLYLSILLRPKLKAELLPSITLAAAVAVFDTLEEIGLRPDIKWPNDVLVNEKKICGILAETAETPGGLAVVVGIGINVKPASFPAEMSASATSIESEGARASAAEIEQALLRHFSDIYGRLTAAGEAAGVIDSWRRRSTYFKGKAVRVTTGTETIEGLTDGLEQNGALRLKRSGGGVAIVQTGEVERLRAPIQLR